MSHSALIKIAPVLTVERYQNPEWTRPGRNAYWSGSLQLLPRETPLLVNHDESRQVGIVRELSLLDWTDGKWIAAHVTITDPPSWLERGTRASFGRFDVHAPLMGEDAKRVASAFVKEVSILSPGVEPAEPLARVEWLGEPEESAVIYGDRRTLVRRFYDGAVLAVGGVPVRGSAGNPRRVGREYVIDQPDGSQIIYASRGEYLSDVGVR